MSRLAADLVLAAMLLTRLPMPAVPLPPRPEGVWAYPVVGAALGATAGLVFWATTRLGVPPLPAAGWALAAGVLLTGALHEDGLADTADGFGGGRDRAGKLAIMRDSRIGSFGTVALVLSFGIRGSALAVLREPVLAMIAAGALSRGTMLAVLRLAPPARADGMAAGLGRPPGWATGVGLAFAAGPALLLPARTAVAALLLAAGCALGMAWLARRQVGGQTGDVLGATAQGTEAVVLTVCAAGLA